MARAVVFDLDGTLIDSLPDIAAAVNHVLARRSLPPLSETLIKTMIGDGAKILLNRAFAAIDAPVEEADYTAFETYYTAHAADLTVVYPGIASALQSLQAAGYVLGVCTNKPQAAAQAVLSTLGLAPYFSVVTGGNSTPYRKPDPRHLAATLAALGSDHAVMIGDHHNDMAAAEGLGVPGIFVTWGYGEAASALVAHKAADIFGLVASAANSKG
jgi:phosphoglycolate phosphatase